MSDERIFAGSSTRENKNADWADCGGVWGYKGYKGVCHWNALCALAKECSGHSLYDMIYGIASCGWQSKEWHCVFKHQQCNCCCV